MPSAEAVGSKARVSLRSLLRCWRVCRVRARARKQGGRIRAAVRDRPRERGSRWVKEVRSAESRVGREGGLKALRERARERAVDRSRGERSGVAMRSQ